MTDQQARSDPNPPPSVVVEPPGPLRGSVVGAIVGVVLAFVGVAGVLLAVGENAATAFGLGGMAAFWGGLGFGSMLGGTLAVVRLMEGPQAEAHQDARAPQHTRAPHQIQAA